MNWHCFKHRYNVVSLCSSPNHVVYQLTFPPRRVSYHSQPWRLLQQHNFKIFIFQQNIQLSYQPKLMKCSSDSLDVGRRKRQIQGPKYTQIAYLLLLGKYYPRFRIGRHATFMFLIIRAYIFSRHSFKLLFFIQPITDCRQL